MSNEVGRRNVLAGFGAGATVAAIAATIPETASAQTSSSPTAVAPKPPFAAKGEATIAYLQAGLQLTQSQIAGPQWGGVVNTVRANAVHRDLEQPNLLSKTDAIGFLTAKILQSAALLKDSRAFLAAFQPLYDTLSADQRRMADGMFNANIDM